ncbi:MAG: ATP-grasp domain-containing protein, partial [Planctomycetales bacterium]|nr:ATP-grasp domain-containing protein [Planctomycetales bacterium]NIM08474.1 ATP-grasp domain-containing protein [Planctomycetales bacterium]NIN07954.1 ATP-grasp domain-containing protein [Planctomycetales bacterium]NIN77082.1 ATP-grasp domain-containing protein [Planctomycetales bacterium]NIO34260.1 ATP-grasp domain-containing protein [Planctomycetales bacterium]
MPDKLLCIGFSVRAAAGSAVRAGFQPLAADYFSDSDLAAIARLVKLAAYPADVVRAARELPAAPFLYTGALENHPEIVQQLQSERELLGNGPAAIRRVRDPFQLAAVLQAAGYPPPPITISGRRLPRDGSWLSKNRRGSGGGHVRPWYGKTASSPDAYFQRRQEGMPCSALFVAAGGRAVLLGATRQLIGSPWNASAGFTYAGSVGPLPLAEPQRTAWNQIGHVLATQFQLSGLFGVDAILQDQTLWPLEVNPRYTASVEVLERALGWHAIRLHVDACRQSRLPAPPETDPPDRPLCGKAILYARCDLAIGSPFCQLAQGLNRNRVWPQLADIPPLGTRIRCRSPICTLLS